MELLLSVGLGVGLAAACGFRVFLPVLVMGLAARSGFLEMSEGFGWVAETPALVALAAAVVFEIGAYYIPWLNSLLDTVAMPTSVAAGVVVAGANIETGSPVVDWSLIAVAGAAPAAVVRAGTSLFRAGVNAITGGLATPVTATGENGVAVGLSVLALLAPLLALGVVLLLVALMPFVWRALKGRQARMTAAGGSG